MEKFIIGNEFIIANEFAMKEKVLATFRDKGYRWWPGTISDSHESSRELDIPTGTYDFYVKASENKLVVPCNITCSTNILPYPVFYQSKAYTCVVDNYNSIFTSRITRFDHPNVAKTINIVADGKVYYLIDHNFKSLSQMLTSDVTSGARRHFVYGMIQKLVDVWAYLAEYGWLFIEPGYDLDILIVSWFQSIFFDTKLGMRLVIVPSLVNSQFSPKYAKANYQKPIIDLAKHLTDFNNYQLELPRVLTAHANPDYTIPDLTVKYPEAHFARWFATINNANIIDADKIGYVDMLMILVCSGVLDPRVPFKEQSLALVESTFRANLDKFGYARTSPAYYLSDDEIKKFLKKIRYKFDMVYSYQSKYNEWTKRDPYPRDNNIYYEYAYEMVDYDIGDEELPAVEMYVRGKIQFSDVTKEVELVSLENVPQTIKINNIEFNSQDLILIFNSGPLISALELKVDEYNPAWLSQKDTKLIADYIQGKILIMTLYAGLSDDGFNNLSYPGSLLFIYNNVDVRQALDNIFEYNINYLQQFRNNLDNLKYIAQIRQLKQLAAWLDQIK